MAYPRILLFVMAIALAVNPVARAAQTQPLAATDDVSRSARAAAATSRAMEELRTEVLAARVTPQITVGQFVSDTASGQRLNDTLQRSARQIGGPRWLDEQTCQVRLELDGRDVAQALIDIASANPNAAPMPASVLKTRLRDWSDRTFVAIGTSTSADRIAHIPLPPGDREAWRAIDDASRAAAVTAARHDAVRRTLDRLRPLELAPGLTVERLLADETANRALASWLSSRPITHVEYRQDLTVELRIASPAEELVDQLVEAGRLNATLDEAARARLEREFARRLAEPVTGRAVASRPVQATQHALVTFVALPDRPPRWIYAQLDGEGVATAAGSRLRTQVAAQDNARENLRSKIADLPLTDSLTIDEAARRDPRIAEAVDRALLRARVYKVDWRDDQGSVLVRIGLDARDLWRELMDAR